MLTSDSARQLHYSALLGSLREGVDGLDPITCISTPAIAQLMQCFWPQVLCCDGTNIQHHLKPSFHVSLSQLQHVHIVFPVVLWLAKKFMTRIKKTLLAAILAKVC